MIVLGKITSIIYKNEQNGYSVFLIKTDEHTITAVGDGMGIDIGDDVELNGEYVTHKDYGKQFAFTTIEKTMPNCSEALIEYISNSGIKGLGKKTALKIISNFGEEAIDTVRYHPEKLVDIKGMNDERAYALSEYLNDEWEKWNLSNFLSKHGIGLRVSNKIYETLGLKVFDVIKGNPYRLLNFVPNLDFKTVDKLGRELDIEVTNIERVKAGILYILSYLYMEGNTCYDKAVITEYAKRMLEISEEYVDTALEGLKYDNKIVIEELEYETYIYQKSIYQAEKNIADFLIQLTRGKCKKHKIENEIQKISEQENIVLSDTQKKAIETCLNNNFTVITGGPGTGKTTIIRCIIDILKDKKISYCLAAPTGRAAKRITETTKEEAKTLHRLLEITKLADDDIEGFATYPVSVIESDVVIVDEASMVDTLLMNNLIKGMKNSSKLILVGDADQLPSVGAGSVLKDIIDSKIANTIFLTDIYRQSASSDIIVSAHKVKMGQHFDFKKDNTDMYIIETKSIEETVENVKTLVNCRIKQKFGENISNDIQIISPIKKTGVGTYEINKVIQQALVDKKYMSKGRKVGDRTLYITDKVMQVKNNYDIEWEDKKGTPGKGVYNGDIGYISDINDVEEYVEVIFDDNKIVRYDFENLEQLEHAYAITVHKSQGSEFTCVIIPIFICYDKFFTRNLIYTAMTRAKSLLIFVGKSNIIKHMIDNTDETKRNTGLKRRLCGGV